MVAEVGRDYPPFFTWGVIDLVSDGLGLPLWVF
jgi:hypothetical protein